MTLQAPGPRREHILAYGPSNAGKTNAWINIAEWIVRTNSPARMYVLDTDLTWEASRPTDGHLDEVVVVQPVYEWSDYKPAMKKLVEQARLSRDNWLVVDMIDKIWSMAQQGGFEYLTDEEFDEFFARSMKEGESIGGAYGVNWQVINKLYQGVVGQMQRFPGHWFACAPATEVRQPDRSGKGGDEPEIRATFGRYGIRPQGQKDLPHLFHTVLLMQETPKGWTMTTVKDRQRERRAGVEVDVVGGFVHKYLIPVAGWRP